MFDVYAFATPNSIKVPIALEELGLDYTLHAVNVRQDEQKTPNFLALNPNAKVPVLVDPDAEGGRLVLTESAAILVYLAEKTGRLLPRSGVDRARVRAALLPRLEPRPGVRTIGILPAAGCREAAHRHRAVRARPSGRCACSMECWLPGPSWPAPSLLSPTSPSSDGCGAASSPA